MKPLNGGQIGCEKDVAIGVGPQFGGVRSVLDVLNGWVEIEDFVGPCDGEGI